MKYQAKSLGKFPQQISYALDNYKPHGLNIQSFSNVIICGLGGSGIAGRIVKAYFADMLPVPCEVVSEYTLPKYAGPKSLVILSSYSGDTEEILGMAEEARKARATTIVLTTGGKLGTLAGDAKLPMYAAEPGFQPRMALGYSLTYLLLIFGELVGVDTRRSLQTMLPSLQDPQPFLDNAKKLFDKLMTSGGYPRKFIVIADRYTAAIGLRFCQQVQENAKEEAFLNELPENNHNVLETYYNKRDSIFLMLDSADHPRTTLRFRFVADLLEEKGNTVLYANVQKGDLLSLIHTIYRLDWLSLMLSDYLGVESENVAQIHRLKNYLAEK